MKLYIASYARGGFQMLSKKYAALALVTVLSVGAVLIGCDENSNYDARTVVFVESINENAPFFSDVLNQGDSLFMPDGVTYKTDDDYIEEDFVLVEFHNRPYNNTVNIKASNLGDFLVTDYTVEYTVTSSTLPTAPMPVPTFVGRMSTLVPATESVTAAVPIVPLYTKAIDPLVGMHYTNDELITYATITFRGHEVQSKREVEFSAGLTVHFADELLEKGDQDRN
jgi:hypothetical protein